MRLGVTTAALCCLVWLAPLSVRADDGQDASNNQSDETESPLSGLKDQLPNRDQLRSLLGTLIQHIGAQSQSAQPATVPPQRQAGDSTEEDLLPPLPSPDTAAPPTTAASPPTITPPPYVTPPQPYITPHMMHHMAHQQRHNAFSQRLLQRRLSLIERIRADAIAHGDADMAARTEQLEAFVVQLHEVGLAGMAQRLGELGALGGGTETAAPSGNVEFPETDFGESSALPETDLGAPADLGDPAELGTPSQELPPELPPPALPDE